MNPDIPSVLPRVAEGSAVDPLPESAALNAIHGQWIEGGASLYGRMIGQKRSLVIADLRLPELDASGRLSPGKAVYLPDYVNRLRAGNTPPPITVLEQEDGGLSVTDGHRRIMAANSLGHATVDAIVWPLTHHPQGDRDSQGRILLVPLTREIAMTQSHAQQPVRVLSEAAFYRRYLQHVDLRGRIAGNADANRESILRDGFRSSYLNLLPPFRGGQPTNIVERAYMPLRNDVVYLVPIEHEAKRNRGVIRSGWKPEPWEAVKLEADGPAMYGVYRASVERHNAALTAQVRFAVDPQSQGDSPSSMLDAHAFAHKRTVIAESIRAHLECFGDRHPSVHIVDTPEGLPVVARGAPNGRRSVGCLMPGGTIYIVAANMPGNAPQAWRHHTARILAHEAIGHFGIAKALGETYFAQIRAQIVDDMHAGRMSALFGEVRRRYEKRDADGVLLVGIDDDTIAHEAIAIVAERGIDAPWWAQLLNAVKQWLRDRGWLRDLAAFTERDIRSMLAQSTAYLRGDCHAVVLDGEANAPVLMASVDAPVFFSPLLQSVETARGAPRSGTAAQWREWLGGAQRRGEYKQAEREWLGVDAWLDGRETTTREDLVTFVRTNQVDVQETVLGLAEEARLPEGWVARFSSEDESWVVEDKDGDVRGEGATRSEAVEDAQDPDESGEEYGVAKFGNYQIPGGSNYKELLLTLPIDREAHARSLIDPSVWDRMSAEQRQAFISGPIRGNDTAIYRSPHFDQPNVLVHVRFNERIASDGLRVLFVEEVQSDWHQKGRKDGYRKGEWTLPAHYSVVRDPEMFADYMNPNAWFVLDQNGDDVGSGDTREAAIEAARQLDAGEGTPHGTIGEVPDAPFKKGWHLLAMKRMIRWAADNGFDRIAWSTGEQQVDRYDLSKQVDRVVVGKNELGYDFAAYMGANNVSGSEGLTARALENAIGKDLTEKAVAALDKPALNKPDRPANRVSFSGLDLKLDGAGMRAFYDTLIPNELGKYVKQWGGEVGQTVVARDFRFAYDPETREMMRHRDSGADEVAVHSLDITPAMRAAALSGQPLFAVAWHATPHAVDRFALAKVGTGEGYQSFGWGIYLASRKAVADWYFKKFSAMTPEHNTERANLYAALVPEDHQLLHYDKPLNEQPDAVQHALHVHELDALWIERDALEPRIGELVDSEPFDKPLLDAILLERNRIDHRIAAITHGSTFVQHRSSEITGGQLLQQIALAFRDDDEMWSLIGKTPHQVQDIHQAASEYLRGLGVPGMCYLDADSRRARAGTCNYVIWDEAAVSAPVDASLDDEATVVRKLNSGMRP